MINPVFFDPGLNYSFSGSGAVRFSEAEKTPIEAGVRIGEQEETDSAEQQTAVAETEKRKDDLLSSIGGAGFKPSEEMMEGSGVPVFKVTFDSVLAAYGKNAEAYDPQNVIKKILFGDEIFQK